jgi:1-acyl-sn-glycerol-3-phosphate acyltransferase
MLQNILTNRVGEEKSLIHDVDKPLCHKCNNGIHQIINGKAELCDDCDENIIRNCCNKYCTTEKCNTMIASIMKEDNLNLPDQKKIDIMSLKKTTYKPSICDRFRATYRAPSFLAAWAFFWFDCKSTNYSYNSFKRFLRAYHFITGIKIATVGLEKLKDDENNKTIYVGNHVATLDAFILPYKIKSGVLGSKKAIEVNSLSRMMKKCADIISVDRGKSTNTVQQMKDFMETRDTLFCFPSGMFTSYDSIPLFRSGAFVIGHRIRPIIIEYEQDVSSLNEMDMILYYPRVNATIHILDPIVQEQGQPIEEFIELVRTTMANHCKFKLANIDSHDITD